MSTTILNEFTPKQQAAAIAIGLLTFLTLGTLAAITACVTVLWLVVQLASLIVTSLIEALGTIGATYQAADPLIRFLMLVCIAYALYWLVARLKARRSLV